MSGPGLGGAPGAEPGRCLGVDLGEARIGLAVTDSARTVAVPRGILARSGDEEADHEALAKLVGDLGAHLVVVGVPLSLDGTIGPAAGRVIAETARLSRVLPVPVETIDERFSTVEAGRRRREAGPAASGTGRLGARSGRRQRERAHADRAPVDAGAAAVILQAYLDRERPT